MERLGRDCTTDRKGRHSRRCRRATLLPGALAAHATPLPKSAETSLHAAIIVTVTKPVMSRCAWCGGVIGDKSGQGRPKRYCRPSHRQRAYESRRLADNRGLEIDDVLISRSSLERHRDFLYLLEAAYEDVLTDSVDATPPQMLKTIRSLRSAVEQAVACDLEIRATGS